MFPRVIMRLCGWCGTSALLAASALTPEQQAVRAARIEAAREDVRRDLTKTRAKYSAMLPVGQRTTWNLA